MMAVRNLAEPGWERSRISRRRVGLVKVGGLVLSVLVLEELYWLLRDCPGGRGVDSGGWGAEDWVEVGMKIWWGVGAGEVWGTAIIAMSEMW